MSSGCLPMTGSIFSQRVDSLPVDTSPAAPIYSGYLTASLRIDGGPGPDAGGIPFLIVPYNQETNAVTLVYPGWGQESTFPPYSVSSPSPGVTSGGTIAGSGPIPSYAPIEDTANGVGQDQHVIVIQEAGGGNPCREFDQWVSAWTGSEWTDSSNLNLPNIGSTGSNAFEMNFQGNGATDSAGLPIAPLVANAEEVIGTGTPTSPNGTVQHPIRVTMNHALARHVWPAVGEGGGVGSCSGGYASGGDSNGLIVQPNGGANQPPTSCTMTNPYGEIYRLKASVYASLPACFATSPQASIIATGLKQYGMIIADNGNTGALVLTNDSQWNSTDLSCLSQLNLGEFEPVNVMGVAANLDANGLPTVSYQASSSTSTPAATPTFSPGAGTYSSAQAVTIGTATPSATIYYTTNGSTPTTGSQVYSGPIMVSSTETVEAIAVASGYSTSAAGSATYTINLPAATPTFSPGTGTYGSTQTVTIGTATPSATIYYTTNGSTPTTGSQVYSGPITVSSTETLRPLPWRAAIRPALWGRRLTPSTCLRQRHLQPWAGTYSSTQTVTIGTATPSATIYYTTNGTTPTTGSQVYSGPITIASTETLQAIAVASGYSTSSVGSAAYTINLPAATPTFSPAAGTYSSVQTVTIGSATPSATNYYTTNGSTPTTGSQVYRVRSQSLRRDTSGHCGGERLFDQLCGSAAYTINLTSGNTGV